MKITANQLVNFVEYTDEKFIQTENTVSEFLRICKDIKDLDILPLKKLNVIFSSDSWDLSPLAINDIERSQIDLFNFENVPNNFKDELKFYIYWSITLRKKNKKIHSIHHSFKSIRLFLIYLNDKYIKSLECIDLGIISDYISYLSNDKNNKYSTMQIYVRDIRNFISFYNSNMTNTDMSNILKRLDKASNKLSSLASECTEENKHNNIPDAYFDSLLSTLMSIMRDKDLDGKIRGYAALIILMSQTGLRIRQMLSLKVNALSKTHISDFDNASHFLEFTIIKKDLYEQGFTVVNQLGYEAYKILEDVFEKSREKLKTDYLFCPSSSKTMPMKPEVFSKNMLRMITEFGYDIGAVNVEDDYPELKTISIGELKEKYSFSKKLYDGYSDDDDIISYPTSHQFRVHLCTYLYHKGVPLAFIQKYMNHLTEEMTDYYVRNKDSSEQDSKFADTILRVIVEEGTKPLGSGSDALMFKINEFIKNGKFKVVEDIDKVISILKGKVPIRQKTGGMCIKSVENRDCRVDDQSDKIYCAYGICPNHFHLYIMADITYNDCKTLIKIIEYNQTEGYLRQANKELGKLQSAIKNALKPEIEQLEDEINKKGVDWIKENHKNLIPIIERLDEIKKEMDEWMNIEPLTLKNN
ncbi:Phage integrase family [uncultured Clostridium sp.]|nr:Phage integrase family [uncultured Clostridium sp.]